MNNGIETIKCSDACLILYIRFFDCSLHVPKGHTNLRVLTFSNSCCNHSHPDSPNAVTYIYSNKNYHAVTELLIPHFNYSPQNTTWVSGI